MTVTFFTSIARSLTLAVSTLGLVGATIYEFCTQATVDPTLLTVTVGLVGAFTGAHISLISNGAGNATKDGTP